MMKHFSVFMALVLALSLLVLPAQSQNKPKPKFDMEAMMARANADDGAPKIGDVAPLFKLDLKFNDFDNEKNIDLNEQVGKQPIVLIFGSYT